MAATRKGKKGLVNQAENMDDPQSEIETERNDRDESNNEKSESNTKYNPFNLAALEPYKEGQDIEQYICRLETWIELTQVPENVKTKLTITVIELVNLLRARFAAKQSQLYERVQFDKIRQGSASITEFINAIRKAAAKCEFKEEEYEDRLLVRLAGGASSEKLVDLLLSDPKMTWEKAISLAQTMEAREKSKAIPLGIAKIAKECSRCGNNHGTEDCKYAKYKCNRCGKIGHLGKKCKSKFPNKGKKEMHRKIMSVDLKMLRSVYTKNDAATITVMVEGKELVFEVDTGAEFSVISWEIFKEFFKKEKIIKENVIARSVTGEAINVKEKIKIKLNGRNIFLHIISAKMKYPLAGRDFIDVAFPNWKECFQTKKTAIKAFEKIEISEENAKEKIKTEFNNVFSKENRQAIKEFKFSVKLKNNVDPVFLKPYGVPLAKKVEVEKELKRLEEEKIIEPVSYSNWASPIVPLFKKDGSTRICVDFKKTVNPNIEVEQYPLPLINDILNSLGNSKVFTVLDLSNAYLQLAIDKNCREMFTINTHKGLFRYTRVPFGVSSAPAVFQNIMEKILVGVERVAVYIDDIIISGVSLGECYETVKSVLSRLEKFNVKVNKEKSEFFCSKVEFLGHEISSEGIKPSSNKLKAIVEAPSPKNITELRAFLGLINYYRRFLKNLSTMIHALYELDRVGVKFVWSSLCEEQFKKAKEAIANSPVIAQFDLTRETSLTTDASSYGIGGVLSQSHGETEKVVAFHSRTLNESERKLPQVQKEALAVIDSVKRFHKYLFGINFKLIVDHQPLKTIFGEKKSLPQHAINRLQNYAIILQAYTYQIQYKSGSKISNADCLSRLPLQDNEPATKDSIDVHLFEVEFKLISAKEVAQETAYDDVLKQVKFYLATKFPRKPTEAIKPYACRKYELAEVNDCLFWNERIVIPRVIQDKVLRLLHDQHIGITKMLLLAKKEVWWPGINMDIENFAAECETCRRFDNKAPTNNEISTWPRATKPFERVHIDFFTKYGKEYLIIYDTFSRFIDVKILKFKDAQTVIREIRNFLSLFGLPTIIVSDNGPPFSSIELKTFFEANKIKHILAPPYHPQSNGPAERGVGIVKKMISKTMFDAHKENPNPDIELLMANLLLKHRLTPCTANGKSPNELIFSYRVMTPFERMRAPEYDPVEAQGEPKYKNSEKVWVQRLGKTDQNGNWEIGYIVSRKSNTVYTVMCDGQCRTVHTGNLKKCKERSVVSRSQVMRE